MRQSSRRARVIKRLALAAALIGTATFAGIAPSSADHSNIFELEGNTHEDAAGAPWDWTSFFTSDGADAGTTPDSLALPDAGFVDSGFDDDYAFPDASTFTGGSKDTLDLGGWSCTSSNNLGGKFDIVNAYSTIYEAAGRTYLFFGIERAATEGDGNMGFWFLHDASADCEKTGGGKAPAFTGHHADGDIFIVAGFSNGGTQATVTAYKWAGGANGALDIAHPFVTGALCGANTHDACGAVNLAEIPTGANKPWPSPDKSGGALDINAFYEGFVSIPSAEVGGCFATFVANTRSSTSPTATIMDFSRGIFPRCAPTTDLEVTPSLRTISAGGSASFTVTETNDGNLALNAPTGGFVQSADCTSITYVSGDTNTNGKLDPAEAWVYTCLVSNVAADKSITIYGHGIDPTNGRDITACDGTNVPAPPATVATCDPDEVATASVDVVNPSTALTSKVEVKYTFYEKNDGDVVLDAPALGYVQATGCTVAEVKKAAPNNAFNTGDANNNTKLDPQETWEYTCSKTFNGPSGGTSFGPDTVTATGHGITPAAAGGQDITYPGDTDERRTVSVSGT